MAQYAADDGSDPGEYLRSAGGGWTGCERRRYSTGRKAVVPDEFRKMDVFAMKRREFLALPLAIPIAIPAFGADERADILSRIKAPRFSERDFDISKFGAVEGGK